MSFPAVPMTRSLCDILYALEIAPEEDVQPDFAIEIMEGVAHLLQSCSREDRKELIENFRTASSQIEDPEKRKFYDSLPDALGLSPE